MKIVSYAENIHELGVVKNNNHNEVIVSSKSLSRFSKVEDSGLEDLLKYAKSLELKVVLEWDILITENDFESVVGFFSSIPEGLYDAVRVQDPGVLEYCLKKTDKPIQYILETGNHNLFGIETWIDYIGDRLDRIVLSIELSHETLKSYISALDCEIELMGLGRILLFYSPRKLLSALLPEDDELKVKSIASSDFIEAIGESEESPHKGFPVLENKHGTFMFHIKDLCLLEFIYDLKDMGLNYLRIDLRFEETNELLSEISARYGKEESFKDFKSLYPHDVIRGYYHINKADVLFKKLKNYRIQRRDEFYIGEVLEASKGEYLAIQLRSDKAISLDDEVRFITPEGKELYCKVHTLQNVKMEDCNEVSKKGDLAFMNYFKGVWSKSQVYLKS